MNSFAKTQGSLGWSFLTRLHNQRAQLAFVVGLGIGLSVEGKSTLR
jgi:hypothetical protein